MKRQNKFFRFISVSIFPILIVLILSSIATMFLLMALTKTPDFAAHPGLFNTLLFFGDDPFAVNKIINNSIAYVVALLGIVLFIVSLAVIKHDHFLKYKSTFVALFLLVPASLGALGGVVDFFMDGLQLLLNNGSVEAQILGYGLIFVYALDILYLIFALLYCCSVIKEARMVSRGVLPELKKEPEPVMKQETLSTEKDSRDEELEKANRQQLLDDIRQIVREELNRLDRVAIITETSVPMEEAEEEIKPEPSAVEPATVEETQTNIIPSNPRVPFAEKMVSADKDIQEKYNELKNEILSYGAASRLSISSDTFRLHRKSYVKITLVGKTLKVYFALNPNDYVDSPIPVTDAGDKSSYEDVPALLRVRSNLSLKRAKELVAATFANDNIAQGEVENHNHVKDIKDELKTKK